MAFFSLTGWAQTVTEVSVNFSKVKYGGDAPVMEVTYNGIKRVITEVATETYASTGNPEFYWDGKYYTDDKCTKEAASPLVVLAKDKHYWVKLVGTEGSIFQGLEPTGWFDVEPVKLTVTAIKDFGKNFGEADPKITLEDITFSGFVTIDGAIETKDVLKEATGGITYSYELKGDEYKLKTIGGIEGKEAQNYTIEPGDVTFTINPADLPAKATGKYTFTAKEGTYKAAKFTGDELPTIAIEGLTAGKDYDIEWYKAPAKEDPTTDDICVGTAVEPTDAGTYYGLVKGKVNYTGTQKDLTWKFTIAKKDLVIYVKNAEKTYDGKPVTKIAADAVVLSGLISTDADAETITGAISAAFKDAGEKKNADEYVMIPVIGGKAITADNWTYNNYNPKPLETGIFTIKKATLTVTAIPQTFEYDGKDWSTRIDTKISDKTVAIAGTVTGEEETVAKLFTIEAAKTEMKEIAPYENAILIVPTEDAATSNYDVVGKNGKVNVVNKNLVILAPTFSTQYGYKVKKSELSVVNNAGIKDASGWKTAPVFTITKGEKTYEDGDLLDEIGEYTIKISNWNALAPDGFSLEEGNVYDGVLTITPKEITPKITTQVVEQGNGLKQQKDEKDDEILVSFGDDQIVQKGEKIQWKLEFNTEGDGAIATTQFAEGKINADADDATYAAGIKIVIPTEVDAAKYANAKYVIKAATGKLIVGNGGTPSIKLDRAGKDDTAPADVIADHAGETLAVGFDNLTMNINEWYAMVLPFEVDPLKMVQVFDRYVIFNELNTVGTTDQNFKFTLKLEPIPAGTPFLVKFAAKAEDKEGAKVNWKGITYADAKISEAINPVETDYVTFTGTYEAFSMQNNKKYADNGADLQDRVWWLCDTGYNGKNTWLKPTNKPHDVAPMEAYLIAAEKWTEYAPSITVEDFDGQTTAIKSLSADKINNLNVVADGWYTVGGMKLQGAPTQKGIYINNGKKVVVK